MGERCPCKAEVTGSIPVSSTSKILMDLEKFIERLESEVVEILLIKKQS